MLIMFTLSSFIVMSVSFDQWKKSNNTERNEIVQDDHEELDRHYISRSNLELECSCRFQTPGCPQGV